MRRLLALVTATQAIRLKQLNPLSYIWREEPYLIEFHAAGADQCDEMKPAMSAVEKELNTRILKWDVWSDPAAYKLMQFLDKGPDGRSKCGGLPFFYNRKTGGLETTFKANKMQKRKHQINSLAAEAAERSVEFAQRRGSNFKTKAETQAKYGW